MTTYVPFSSSYLLPVDGNIVLYSNNFASASGAIGPVTVKLTNTEANTAVVSYGNPFVQPIVYPNIEYDVAGQVIHLATITVYPGETAIIDISNENSTSNWEVGDTFVISGAAVGGTSPENDLTFTVTATNPAGGPGKASAAILTSGVVPGPSASNPELPTENNPTQVVIVSPGSTEYVQIPGSIVAPNYNPLILYAAGANVYVTPVQIVA